MRSPSPLVIPITLLALLAPSAARADDKVAIVVLPFSSDVREIDDFGKPAADVVAGALAKQGLGARAAGVDGELPPRGDLVVELRASGSARKLALEGVVRDPEHGELVAQVATKPVPLRHLDRAAADLARRLGPPILDAAAERRARKERAAREAAALVDPDLPVDPATPTTSDDRPLVYLWRATGTAARGNVPVEGIGTELGARMLSSLGYRVQVLERDKQPPAGGARGALVVHVASVEFDWRGVLLARGRVRVVVLDAAGRRLLARTVRTDTVVGSKGDRHDALVRFVIRQALDMVRKDVAKVLR